ncbi:MAG TPA: hypothetical protein VFS58_07465 [Steroidobacteraceae bacterium]|nr:hypothetical protein [Steroidobacteraceae bacterium]
MALTQDIIDLLAAGVGHQVGGCANDGRPSLCRGLAAQLEPDGRLVVILSAESGFEVLAAVRQNGRIALNLTLPENYKSISLLGRDAVVSHGGAEFRELVNDRYQKFRSQLDVHGIPPAYTEAWYVRPDDDLMAIRFTPFSARNQTPGPDAGSALALTNR